ncbi:MAG: aldo/keto reductase, partial [Candidatus Eisenbacteria bacterium]|nr:aldo/keto reductase [Candidatus Eisenbacteria bacterium]
LCLADGIGMIVYSPLAQGVLTNKYAGGAVPAGSRAAGTFAHFMASEKQLTPENAAAAERFAACVAKHGAWTPAQVALAWVLRRPGVSSVILGATAPAHVEENVKAAEVQLSDEAWREIEAAVAGPNAAPARGAGKKRVAARKKAAASRARRR